MHGRSTFSAAALRTMRAFGLRPCTTPVRGVRSQAMTRPVNANPPLFHQTVVHSDGSTFTLRTTSPKSILFLTRDTRNHPLWNPSSEVADDRSGELRKFSERFSDIGDMGSFEDELVNDASSNNAGTIEDPMAAKAAAAAGADGSPGAGAQPAVAGKKGKKK